MVNKKRTIKYYESWIGTSFGVEAMYKSAKGFW